MITVSAAIPGDALAMAELLEEMDRFYGASGTELVGERVKQINEAVSPASPPPGCSSLGTGLAWRESRRTRSCGQPSA